jgi:glycosyltransferase involved in cell wall biosynthesis
VKQSDGILFLSLSSFSATGGIEKVCRIAGKALFELAKISGKNFTMLSMHDSSHVKNDYFPGKHFKGFAGNKIKFVISSVVAGFRNDVVILSHVNLLLVGFLIKILSRKTKVVLIAHGIEVWDRFPSFRKKMFRTLDLVLAVSEYTRQKLLAKKDVEPLRCKVVNNCLDPFLKPVQSSDNKAELRKRYKLHEENLVLMTLTRLSFQEKYKGYDTVIEALPGLLLEYPLLRYLIVGKYDKLEKQRVDTIIEELGMTDKVIFTGFVADEEIADHFNLSDLYIMPSTNEGFGIVFIEAMYYGKPVIAGNVDGSVDALSNGQLGTLVNPNNTNEIAAAVKKIINNKSEFIPDRSLLMQKFSYEVYKRNLRESLAILKN